MSDLRPRPREEILPIFESIDAYLLGAGWTIRGPIDEQEASNYGDSVYVPPGIAGAKHGWMGAIQVQADLELDPKSQHGHYEWGRHSSDLNHVNVAYVVDGNRDELFDVTLYHIEADDESDGAYIESLEALELLIKRANAGLSCEAFSPCEECGEAPVDADFKGADGLSVCDDCREGDGPPSGGPLQAQRYETQDTVEERLEYLRGELRAERISMGELIELQGYGEAGQIPRGDVELREAAGLPEFPEDGPPSGGPWQIISPWGVEWEGEADDELAALDRWAEGMEMETYTAAIRRTIMELPEDGMPVFRMLDGILHANHCNYDVRVVQKND